MIVPRNFQIFKYREIRNSITRQTVKRNVPIAIVEYAPEHETRNTKHKTQKCQTVKRNVPIAIVEYALERETRNAKHETHFTYF